MCLQHVHQIEVIDAHNGLSDSCILCSQQMLAFIGGFDWNRLPTAELERDCLQHGFGNQNTECKCTVFVYATDYVYKCLIQFPVLTAVTPPN